ncbi:hypothetical protein ACFW2D_17930 [Streptomyces sp. NPDC058914]|uniref:hypothetical protein n=1 Tax=Streptomyces sp. NPDC058914 TaxID=3346671 RepID=UPI0036AE7F3B
MPSAHWTVEIPTSNNGVQVFTYSASEYRDRSKVEAQARDDAITERAIRRRGGATALLEQMKTVWHDDLLG